MRLYVPADLDDLETDQLTRRPASAVTPALRAALPEEDEEGLERSAFLTAADLAVLALAGRERGAVRARRVVLALEVPADRLTQGEADPDLPSLAGTVEPRWPDVVSIHLDAEEDQGRVRAAFDDDEAFEALAEVDLLWVDPAERDRLVRGELEL